MASTLRIRQIAPGVALLLVLTGHAAGAQGGYEYEVYGSETAPKRSIIFELHINHTFRGPEGAAACSTAPPVDDSRVQLALQDVSTAADCSSLPTTLAQWTTTRGPLYGRQASTMSLASSDTAATYLPTHTTVEITTGLTAWSELGVYLFTTEASGTGTQWSGGSIRPMVRVPRSWHWPLGMALSTEVEYERPQSGAATWTWEIRPILDKTLGRWYLSVNPTLEYPLHGSGTTGAVQFSPSAKVSYDATRSITAGIEYYGAYGPIDEFASPSSRLQQFFGTADLHVSSQWELNVGVGVGATPVTSQLVAKLIVGRRFSWGNDPVVR
jgi:hypothetical protein